MKSFFWDSLEFIASVVVALLALPFFFGFALSVGFLSGVVVASEQYVVFFNKMFSQNFNKKSSQGVPR